MGCGLFVVAPCSPAMAWEWVAPVATGALGATGIVFTWLSGKQGRDHAENLAKLRNDHEATLAKEERTQQRLANAYIALLEMAERVGMWAQMVRPMVDTIPPQPVPRMPDIDVQGQVNALVGAYGSSLVRERLDAWRAIVLHMISMDRVIGMSEQHGTDRASTSGADFTEFWEKIHEDRPKELEARKALTDQIAAELGHRSDGPES
jgi:hypothetical protein